MADFIKVVLNIGGLLLILGSTGQTKELIFGLTFFLPVKRAFFLVLKVFQ